MQDLVDEAVAAIERGFAALLALCSDPSEVTFAELRNGFERLEQATNSKPYLDAVFAYLCDRDGAGRAVGAAYASEYLVSRLGISNAEAFARLHRGRDLFAPPAPPPGNNEEEGEDSQGGFDFGDADAAAGDADAQNAAGEQQRRTRDNAQRVSAEKTAIIDRALRGLTDAASSERAGILEKATREAAIRPPEDLRKYVERLVAQANRKHKVDDPNAAWEKRGIYTREDKASGKYTIVIETTAAVAALFKAHTDLGLPANSNLPDAHARNAAGVTDPRTPAQRRHDQLVTILNNWENHLQHERGGAASVVLAVTMDDLAGADHNTAFSTNTGIELTPAEIMRLGFGATDSDYIVQIDRVTGLPLSLGRTRLAGVHQRIALLALQGVCAWEGCTRPMSELEIHHIEAYCQGGDTSLENLIGLCRTHHRQNNDHKDGRDGRRHVERCPDTGNVGVQYCDGTPLRVNQTQGHTDSPGYKLRHRGTDVPAGAPPDPPLFPAEPPGPPTSPPSSSPPSSPIPEGCPF